MTRRVPDDLTRAVRAALARLDLQPVDEAAGRLAREYAAAIDAGACTCERCPAGDVARHGPGLLAVLESLGMTPRARQALVGKGGQTGDPRRSELDDFRARRARQRDAAAVDPAAT